MPRRAEVAPAVFLGLGRETFLIRKVRAEKFGLFFGQK